jgi:glycosyltransferase involved in cell wall biosynthesis
MADRPGRRVLQIVGLLSVDGAYGGPTVVAIGQSRALAEAGHQPTLLTGWDGAAAAPAELRVVRRRAWKLARRSFASLVSPSMLLWFLVRARRFDVVHVHMARDLLTLPLAGLALLLRIPLVVQTHGMIIEDGRRSVRALDAVLTRRVLRRASVLIALTPAERTSLLRLGARADRIVLLPNAAPVTRDHARFAEHGAVVFFVSRLAARKRPVAFVETAALVAARRADVRFEIWGPDGGELPAVLDAVARLRLGDSCAYRGAASMDRAQEVLAVGQVLVLPSFAEPYPMVVLEAMALGLPAVITSETGLSERLGVAAAAAITSGEPAEMASAVLRLLAGRDAWTEMSEKAKALAVGEFGPEAMAHALAAHYEQALTEA